MGLILDAKGSHSIFLGPMGEPEPRAYAVSKQPDSVGICIRMRSYDDESNRVKH